MVIKEMICYCIALRVHREYARDRRLKNTIINLHVDLKNNFMKMKLKNDTEL